MPYIIIRHKGEEVARQQLRQPLTIGRAPECDLCVRDILLSRRHCRLQPTADGAWLVIDLESKNGTAVNGRRARRQILLDSDQLEIGHTTVTLHNGTMPPSATSAPVVRPADRSSYMAVRLGVPLFYA